EAPPSPAETGQDAKGHETPSGDAPLTRRVTTIFVTLCLLIIAGAVAWMLIPTGDPIADLEKQGATAFESGDYRAAARHYGALAKSLAQSHPDDPRIKDYEFYRDLSLVLAEVNSAIIETDRTMAELRRFLKQSQNAPLLTKNKDKVWDVYRLL